MTLSQIFSVDEKNIGVIDPNVLRTDQVQTGAAQGQKSAKADKEYDGVAQGLDEV